MHLYVQVNSELSAGEPLGGVTKIGQLKIKVIGGVTEIGQFKIKVIGGVTEIGQLKVKVIGCY